MIHAFAVSIRDLRISFRGLERTVQAVRGVNLDVEKGEIMGIVGESGCGKSLTAAAILGITPESATISGSIRLNEQELVGQPESILRKIRGRRAAMIFQNPMRALNPFFTVGHQMCDIIRLHGEMSLTEARMIARRSLEDVNMADPEQSLRKYPHQMSGGQLQRVMIALALSCKPDLLIADEPTTALDVTVQAQVVMLMRELARQRNLTVIFITHDLGLVASICDKVTVMYAGEVVETAPVRDIFSAPKHPYTAKLINLIPMVGRGRTPLETIPGRVPDLAFPPTGCAFHDRCGHASDRCREEHPAFQTATDASGFACHHPIAARQKGLNA